MIRSFFKIAGRNLIKHKSSTLINILGLALGTCACLVIYLIASLELRYDRFHPGRDKIYRIVSDQKYDGKNSYFGFVTDPMAMTIRKEISGHLVDLCSGGAIAAVVYHDYGELRGD